MVRVKTKHTTVSIPTSLYKKIEKRIKETGFRSVSEYVIFVLREILSGGAEEKPAFSKKDEEKVKSRLRALGYLD